MIAWDGCLENALDIHSQLSEGGIDYLVWNVSSQDIDDKHWVRAEDIRYYGHFWNSLKDFRDILSHRRKIFNIYLLHIVILSIWFPVFVKYPKTIYPKISIIIILLYAIYLYTLY
jgi:hypothetical protein